MKRNINFIASIIISTIFGCNFSNSKNMLKNAYLKNQNREKNKRQVILKDMHGKSKILEVNSEENIYSINLLIQDLYGIKPQKQILISSNRKLDPQKKLEEYEIKDLQTIYLTFPIYGGMQAIASKVSVLFPHISSNEKDIIYGDVGSTGPVYKTITSGFNVAYKCKNPKCKSYGDYVWIMKECGLGTFNISILFNYKGLNCSSCNQEVDEENVLGAGFFDCYYSAKGVRLKDPTNLPIKKNSESFTLKERKTKLGKIEKFFSNLMGIWIGLEIKTKPLSGK